MLVNQEFLSLVDHVFGVVIDQGGLGLVLDVDCHVQSEEELMHLYARLSN